MEVKITWRKSTAPKSVGNFLVCGFEVKNSQLRKRIDIAYWSKVNMEWSFESGVPMSVEYWAQLPELPAY